MIIFYISNSYFVTVIHHKSEFHLDNEKKEKNQNKQAYPSGQGPVKMLSGSVTTDGLIHFLLNHGVQRIIFKPIL